MLDNKSGELFMPRCTCSDNPEDRKKCPEHRYYSRREEHAENGKRKPEDWAEVMTEICENGGRDKNGRLVALFTEWLLASPGTKFLTIMDSDEMLQYENGIFVPFGENAVESFVHQQLDSGGELKTMNCHLAKEIVSSLKRSTYTKREAMNPQSHICLENGLLNLETLKIEEHTPDLPYTYKIPVKFDADKKPEAFLKFLGEVQTPENIALLQEIAGYCLLTDHRFQYFFILWGSGANGKSVFLTVLHSMLGSENVSGISLQSLAQDRFAVGELYGKLANIYADLDKTALKSTGMLKIATGGDWILADKKHSDHFRFKNHAKMIFSANQLPMTPDDSDAFWRRAIIITWNVQIAEDKRDETLTARLCQPDELSGVLNWALEGLARLLKQRKLSYFISPELRRALYIKKSDPVGAFVEEMLLPSSGGVVEKEIMYHKYLVYCNNNGMVSISEDAFSKRLIMVCARKDIMLTTTRLSLEGRPRAWLGVAFQAKEPETPISSETGETQEMEVETIKMSEK